MVIELPDEMVRRLEPVAVARGETIEEAALEALDVSPLLIEPVASVEVPHRRRLPFIGSGSSGDTRPTDIHRLRREIADQRTA